MSETKQPSKFEIKIFDAALHNAKEFGEATKNESDRAIAIVAACILDNLLETLLRRWFVKGIGVDSLFSNDHILQSFYAKINIAYYSGLLSTQTYHDLKCICTIRNKFAHEISSGKDFNESQIKKLIEQCELKPLDIDDFANPSRLKFVIIVQQIIVFLGSMEIFLTKFHPPKLVDCARIEGLDLRKSTLTRAQLLKDKVVIRKKKAQPLLGVVIQLDPDDIKGGLKVSEVCSTIEETLKQKFPQFGLKISPKIRRALSGKLDGTDSISH